MRSGRGRGKRRAAFGTCRICGQAREGIAAIQAGAWVGGAEAPVRAPEQASGNTQREQRCPYRHDNPRTVFRPIKPPSVRPVLGVAQMPPWLTYGHRWAGRMPLQGPSAPLHRTNAVNRAVSGKPEVGTIHQCHRRRARRARPSQNRPPLLHTVSIPHSPLWRAFRALSRVKPGEGVADHHLHAKLRHHGSEVPHLMPRLRSLGSLCIGDGDCGSVIHDPTTVRPLRLLRVGVAI